MRFKKKFFISFGLSYMLSVFIVFYIMFIYMILNNFQIVVYNNRYNEAYFELILLTICLAWSTISVIWLFRGYLLKKE